MSLRLLKRSLRLFRASTRLPKAKNTYTGTPSMSTYYEAVLKVDVGERE